MQKANNNIRNIAIVAHVDHGKTTLVDALFRYAGVNLDKFSNQNRVMDSGDIERERGITISAKNCSIFYKGVKINIIDTPGHSDFAGEVERGLSMVDGVILLCDASEGPMAQTRFVLEKAIERKLKVIIVINKVDKINQRAGEVLDEVYDLLLDISNDEDILNSPAFFAVGKEGRCSRDVNNVNSSMSVLLDAVLDYVPPPVYDEDCEFAMLVCDLSYSDYLGRLVIGKVVNGSANVNDSLIVIDKNNNKKPLRVSSIQTYSGPSLVESEKVEPGDIVVLSGINDVEIGDTICSKNNTMPLERINVDEPTVSMIFAQNYSPLAGKEGDKYSSAKIEERLKKECLKNISISYYKNKDDTFSVLGRGEFQIAILIENMRREGFELCVGRPNVIFKKGKNGEKLEPIERLYISVHEEYSGAVMEKIGMRKAEIVDISYLDSGIVKITSNIPSRGMIGLRDEIMTDTKGYGVMHSYILGYEPYKGDMKTRSSGSLIADRSGKAVAYGIWELESRGRMFIEPGDELYEGMVVGEHNRENDLMLNPTKTKKLTNLRASGKDEAVSLTPIVRMTLESAIQFIKEDEMVEVTPSSIRICKKILSTQKRKIFNNRGILT